MRQTYFLKELAGVFWAFLPFQRKIIFFYVFRIRECLKPVTFSTAVVTFWINGAQRVFCVVVGPDRKVKVGKY